MDQSRSKRQVLVLDCCNSGAFSQGTKAATGTSVGTATAFESGYGRIILTASDSTQFAWEGDKVIGETDNSLFTHFLVQGLDGEADLDGDGRITVDELYDYAYEKVKFATPKQTPSKFSGKQQGEILLRQITRIKDIKPASLPEELTEATEDSRTFVRESAVQQLAKLLKGKNLGLARSAREALERIEREDDSIRVRQAASQVLESFRVVEEKAEAERKAREEADRLAALKDEEERLLREKEAAERRAKVEAEKLQRAKAEREATEKAAHEATKKAEREAALKAELEAAELAMRQAAEKAAKEKAEEEVAREKAAREKAVRENAEREKVEQKAIKKSEHEAKEKETRSRAEKRRQRYLELLNKTIHVIKLYYQRVLLIAIAVTLIVLGGKVAPSVLPLISTSSPHPTATSLLLSILSSPLSPTKTRIPTVSTPDETLLKSAAWSNSKSCQKATSGILNINSPWLGTEIILDGKITTAQEWSDAVCLDLTMDQPRVGPATLSSRWWFKNDGQWLYLLVRVPTVASFGDTAYIDYFWEHSDLGGIDLDGHSFDSYGYNDPNWSDDILALPPGENNVKGGASGDTTYRWFEFKKALNSGDGYDWNWAPGQTAGTSQTGLFVGIYDSTRGTYFEKSIQLYLGTP
jgi:hypothetical protein